MRKRVVSWSFRRVEGRRGRECDPGSGRSRSKGRSGLDGTGGCAGRLSDHFEDRFVNVHGLDLLELSFLGLGFLGFGLIGLVLLGLSLDNDVSKILDLDRDQP